jgi:hypothetical protein
MDSIRKGDLPGNEYRQCSPEHDLPYFKVEPADLPDGDEEEDRSKYDNGKIRTSGLSLPKEEYWLSGTGWGQSPVLCSTIESGKNSGENLSFVFLKSIQR